MIEDIVSANEKAYFERNHVSLKDIWSRLSEGEKASSIERIRDYDKVGLEKTISFLTEDILRIMIGFGGRSCLEKARENVLPTLRIVVWEPDPVQFCAYCTKVDISDIIRDKKISFVIGDDLKKLDKILRDNIQDNNAFHNKVIAVGQYADSNNIFVQRIVELLGKIAEDVTQDGFARKSFNVLPCRNMLFTIKNIYKNYVVSQLLGVLPIENIPLIIVAAGPSLTRNCIQLKKAKNRALIVAVTHAMKTLSDNGVVPDLVALTDASATGYMDFDKDRRYTMLCSVYADKDCVKDYNGKVIYHGFRMINHLFSTKRTLSEPYAEQDTGSVATDVFSLGISAGFKNIILVGQDLAYGEAGYTHAGNEFENSVYEQNDLYMEVDDIYGKKVKTRGDWNRFRLFFEKSIEEHKEVHVIDATEGGALIRGTDIMTLSEAIEKNCSMEYPIEELINTLDNGGEEEKGYIDAWFGTVKDDLCKMYNLIEEAIDLNRSILDVWNTPSLWTAEFGAACKRYDVLYNQIMEGTKGDVLRLYCIEAIQNYLENALILEGDENTESRMKMEQDLFVFMKEQDIELERYVNEL